MQQPMRSVQELVLLVNAKDTGIENQAKDYEQKCGPLTQVEDLGHTQP